jgi:hypothetical protein
MKPHLLNLRRSHFVSNLILAIGIFVPLVARLAAADGDLAGELKHVKDRYREVLATLREKAVAKSDKQTAAEIDAILKAEQKPPAIVADAHPSLPPKDSKWKGELSTGVGSKQAVTATTTQSQGDTFTVRAEMDGGAIWDWTFKFNRDGRLQVTEFVRIRTMRGVTQGPGTGGVTGTGEIKNGELSWRFSWPQGGDTFRGNFKLNLKD